MVLLMNSFEDMIKEAELASRKTEDIIYDEDIEIEYIQIIATNIENNQQKFLHNFSSFLHC